MLNFKLTRPFNLTGGKIYGQVQDRFRFFKFKGEEFEMENF